jgi:hypothetical protein
MSLGFRLLTPFLLAGWLAVVVFLLSHAESAPSSRHALAQRISLCPDKR